jgi:hypothetical protein
MKITDTTGRSMLVDLVYKHPSLGWLQAPAMKIAGRGTQHVRVPYGQYALRICSMTGAEAILFEDGQKLVQTTVGPNTQFIEFDSARNALSFRAPGEPRPVLPATDVVVRESEADATEGGAPEATAIDPNAPTFRAPQAPEGHGFVFAVVRFAKENSPFGEPPQEEFEIGFQLREPGEHDNFFAENLRHVEQAPALPNPLDPLSHTPPSAEDTQHRPSIKCTFGGCNHKH